MGFFNKFKDRYNIVLLILAILMFALAFKLSILTIAKGDYYRNEADNRRQRTIHTTAPRGEIRDRHGRLLAGNVPSFTVQLFKDELNRYDMTKDKSKKNLKKNEAFLELIRLLEEDGVEYVDDYPLSLNTFEYKDISAYDTEVKKPIDKVVDIIIENNLVYRVLSSVYIGEEYPEQFDYIVANRTLNAYRKKGMDIPIDFEIIDGQLSGKYNEKKDAESWRQKNKIHPNASPIEALVQYLGNDPTVIKTTIDNSISRKLVYDILVEQGLQSNIILEDYSITYEKEYIAQKRLLMKTYPEITMETTAGEDFVNIFKKTSLRNFLEESYEIGKDKKEIIVPGEILIKMMEDKKVEVPVKLVKNKDKSIVEYEFTGESLSDYGEYEDIIDLLMDYGDKTRTLEAFLSSEKIKGLAQNQMLVDGVNPRISVSSDELEYVYLNNLYSFYSEHKIKEDKAKNMTPKGLLDHLVKFYNIDKRLSDYEILPILNVYDQIKKQGYLAYQPINLAYGIKDSTVAKIEESMMEIPGINISVEPVRYYPEGKSAAHILGYLGKISQADEIEKYVEEKGYSKNAIIGKTGIEESMEDKLAGESGINQVEVDSLGNTIKKIESESVKPIPGDNVYLSIDLKLQQVAEEALQQTLEKIQVAGTYESKWGNFKFSTNKGRPYKNATSGAVVAIDVKTGQVLASASYPSYDPNLFSTGISSTDWSSLFPENENDLLAPRPLYNIATQTAVQPGSVYKMATALTALDKGLSPDKKIRDMGKIDIGNSEFKCLTWTLFRNTHGPVNVYEAIRDSCNYYFYTLALGKNQKTGESLGMHIDINDIADMSKKLGLGDRTGIEINIPRESAGGIPDPERKTKTTKALLNNLLKLNIDMYYEEGYKPSEEKRQEDIDTILSWMDMEVPMSRGEVISNLEEMNIMPETPMGNNKREGLADIIKFTYLNQVGWNITDTLNVTIGQGQAEFTPIQMANYVAIIANGGYRHELTLLESIMNYNNSENIYSHEVNGNKIQLNDYNNLEALKKGMNLVAKSGTARRTFEGFPIEVGVKTGTAEKDGKNPATGEPYDNFAWFVGFGPYEDPEIAVATLLFQGGSGSHGGPLVRDIMAEYLGLNKIEIKDNLPYENFLSR